MSIDFSNWLIKQMQEKDWTEANLAQRAKISSSALVRILAGDRRPGIKVSIGLSKALKIPTETVLLQAGYAINSSQRFSSEKHKKWFELLYSLDEEDLAFVENLCNTLNLMRNHKDK